MKGKEQNNLQSSKVGVLALVAPAASDSSSFLLVQISAVVVLTFSTGVEAFIQLEPPPRHI